MFSCPFGFWARFGKLPSPPNPSVEWMGTTYYHPHKPAAGARMGLPQCFNYSDADTLKIIQHIFTTFGLFAEFFPTMPNMSTFLLCRSNYESGDSQPKTLPHYRPLERPQGFRVSGYEGSWIAVLPSMKIFPHHKKQSPASFRVSKKGLVGVENQWFHAQERENKAKIKAAK